MNNIEKDKLVRKINLIERISVEKGFSKFIYKLTMELKKEIIYMDL